MQRTCHKTIVIHPHTGQFVINELPTLVLCGTVWVYGGMEGTAIDSYCHSSCRLELSLVLYRYHLPAPDTLLHRHGTTCQ